MEVGLKKMFELKIYAIFKNLHFNRQLGIQLIFACTDCVTSKLV